MFDKTQSLIGRTVKFNGEDGTEYGKVEREDESHVLFIRTDDNDCYNVSKWRVEVIK